MTVAKPSVPTTPTGRYLLDTHAFLFLDQAPEMLPPRLRTLLEDTRSRLFVSTASLWEIQIKLALGKLATSVPIERMMARQQRENDVDPLPIDIAHVVELGVLPALHRDPFDRMLIAQARVEGLTMLSRDVVLKQYDVPVRW